MGVPGYPISMLVRQLALGEDAFSRRHPNCWLVWEAGASRRFSEVNQSLADTSLSEGRPGGQRPKNGDAWCFVLTSPDGAPLRVGRALENELVLADPTVSRVHAVLEPRGLGWHLVPKSKSRQTIVGGRTADPERGVALVTGMGLELGGLRLAFYDSEALKRRVASLPLRAAR